MSTVACIFLHTAGAFKWAGFVLGLCALVLFAALLWQHAQAGRAFDRDQEDDQP